MEALKKLRSEQSTTNQDTNQTTQVVKVGVADARNPYLEKGLEPWERLVIEKEGTPQKKKWLRELIESEMTPAEREYRKKLATTESPSESKEVPFEVIGRRMIEKIMRKQEKRLVPDAEMYQRARLLLFDAYRAWVFQRTSTEPVITPGDEISTALSLVAHWLIGLEKWQGLGPDRPCFDPRKSLYFCGDPGNGKSSIAIAAGSASRELAAHYGTGRGLEYRSMNQVVTDIMTTNSLLPLSELSKGGLVIDELRLEHLTHKHYGNDIDIMADVLLQRWESWNYLGHQTIITSNITPAELADNIADDKERVRSRIRDQFQIVKFNGPSFRASKMIEYDLSSK